MDKGAGTSPDPVAGPGVHGRPATRRRIAPGVRHMPRLPAVLQSVRFVPPPLFELIDGSETGELDAVGSDGFASVVDACTLCDLCFMTKCPYVPPHEFNIDFPHLMLRARAAQNAGGKTRWVAKQIRKADRNGRLAAPVAGLVNWATRTGNWLTRPVIQALAGIHAKARVPKYRRKTLMRRAKAWPPPAPEPARKVVLFATCSGNHNNPEVGVVHPAHLGEGRDRGRCRQPGLLRHAAIGTG